MKDFKQVICSAIILSGMFFLSANPARALKVEDVPNPRQVNDGWVTDMADLLSPQSEAKLNKMISDLEAKNGTEIAVVTVPETAPYQNSKQFATELFNYWGIGKKEKNNGVLFLISRGERRVEIETGYGIVPILPNAKVREIIEREIIPKFKQGQFETGIVNGTNLLIIELDGNSNRTKYLFAVIFGSTAFLLSGYGLKKRRKKRKLFLEPDGTSENYYRDNYKKICCARCKEPMNKVSDRKLLSHLNEPQKVSLKLTRSIKGWQCSNCYPDGKKIHIRKYRVENDRYTFCPNCQEITVENRSKKIATPTKYSPGKTQITQKCKCCNYSDRIEKVIPSLSSSRNIRIKSKSSSSYYSSSSYSSGSSYSGGCDSGGGSSFGGGSSGGDGGGGSW